uniref:NmrA-like domain-containing protein n=1 Tax=Oryza punctata TaxID=4537 RepID=A0A0E0ML61_ORYPU
MVVKELLQPYNTDRAEPYMAMEKSRVLIVGGTGYIGRRIVAASLAEGHPTYVLLRPEVGLDIDKLQMLLAFKAQGARLVEAHRPLNVDCSGEQHDPSFKS